MGPDCTDAQGSVEHRPEHALAMRRREAHLAQVCVEDATSGARRGILVACAAHEDRPVDVKGLVCRPLGWYSGAESLEMMGGDDLVDAEAIGGCEGEHTFDEGCNGLGDVIGEIVPARRATQ